MEELGRKRCEKFENMLHTHKQKKLMKNAPTESQIIKLAEKEIALKEQMMKQLEVMNQEQTNTMNMLATNMKTLTDTMMSAFSMLQHSLQLPSPSNFHYG